MASAAATVIFVSASVAVSYGLSQALAPDTPTAKGQKAPRELINNVESPRWRIWGRCVVAGNRIFGASDGNDLHRVIYHAEQVDRIEEYRINNRPVIADSEGDVKSAPYKTKLQIKERLGAASQLVFGPTHDAFPNLWPSSARGDGLTMTAMVAKSPGMQSERHLEIWTQGKPFVIAVCWGAPIYDPRRGEPDDPSAWVATDNSILTLLAIYTLPVAAGGLGWSIDRFHLDDLRWSADRADRPRPLKGGGTEPWSRLWGRQDLSAKREEIVAQMLKCAGAVRLLTSDGRYTFRLIEDVPEPTVHLAAEDILDIVSETGAERIRRASRWQLFYLAPESDVSVDEASLGDVRWAGETGEAGEAKRLEYPFCPSHAQAGWLARHDVAAEAAETGTIRANLAGLALWGHDTFTFEDPDTGETKTARLARPVVFGGPEGDAPVTIDYRVVGPLDAWDPDLDEPTPPPVDQEIADGNPVDPPEILDVFPLVAGGSTRICVECAFEGDRSLDGAIRRRTGRTYTPWRPLTDAVAPGYAVLQSDPINPDGTYDVMVQAVQNDFDVSAWVRRLGYSPAADTTPPSPPSLLVVGGAGTLTATLVPAGARSASLLVRVDATTIHDGPPSAVPLVLTPTVPAGVRTVTAWGRDGRGVLSDPVSQTVTVTA